MIIGSNSWYYCELSEMTYEEHSAWCGNSAQNQPIPAELEKRFLC